MGSNRNDDKDNMGKGRLVVVWNGDREDGGRTKGRERWRKENGGNERGLTAEGGGRRRKYFSTSAGGKGCH